jgi:hypothetical protein
MRLYISIAILTAAGNVHVCPTNEGRLDNKDSIRRIYRGDKIHKEISYYPNGKMESKTTWLQDSTDLVSHASHQRYKSVSWALDGRKTERFRANIRTQGAEHKDIYWVFREDGRICLKRKTEGWTSKY